MKGKLARLPLALLVFGGLIGVGCPFQAKLLGVTPLAINFGVNGELESFAITNEGNGTLVWSISVSFFRPGPDGSEIPDPGADWLDVSPLGGTTTTETDRVMLTATRDGLPEGTSNARLTITTSDGEVQEVLVAIRTPGDPELSVEPGTLNINCPNATGEFTITNTGDGALSWNIVAADPDNPGETTSIPDFVSVSPASFATLAGQSTTVTVAVDCDALPSAVQNVTLLIQAGVGSAQVVIAIGGEGIGPEISVDPSVLDFGQNLNELTFDVFNTGETGSILDFTITTDRSDLIILDPTSGTSIGQTTDVGDGTSVIGGFDRVPITVTIDRTAIQSMADGGTITVSADGAAPVEVSVIVEAAPLTIEGAANRSRPPALQRFVFLMRDSVGDVIQTSNPSVLERISFSIDEDGVPLDLDETNFFVSGPENLKMNLVLMLDFTGSMFNAGLGNGTAIEQSKTAAKRFIDGLPESWRIAVMEYHQRQQSTFLIHPFSTDKEALKTAIDDFTLEESEHGASTIFDALAFAAQALVDEDDGVLEFDGADVRAVVFISDGRDTSSTIEVSEISSFAQEQPVRTRFYPIGFGEDVNASPLVQLAQETGGHSYMAANTNELAGLLGTAGDEGEIVTDLRNQVVLTYPSLLQRSATYLITASFDVSESQTIEGSFQRDAVVFGGDVRAGQISMHTTGISDGSAEVYVRADYAPRNVNRIRFRLFIDPNVNLPIEALAALTNTPPTIELAPEGILVDPLVADRTWRLVLEPDATITGIRANFVWTVLTEEDNPIPFGNFGNMVRITFPDLDDFVSVMEGLGETPIFELGLRVDNRIYFDPPTRIFWEYPGGRLHPTEVLKVGFQSDTASPAPTIEALQTIGFDPDEPDAFNQDASDSEGGIPDFDDRFPNNDNLS